MKTVTIKTIVETN